VPIPVFYDRETGTKYLLNEHTLSHIQSLFHSHGSDAWWTMDEESLLPDMYKADAHKWKKGTDTMDVWFDSGSSWAGVCSTRSELAYPADMYLEGSDQHRGWFQSSLLTSVAAQNAAPYKTVLTHGFVLDEKGFKMSKSLGNVVDPMTIINGGNNLKTEPAYGADVLRLWVASVDYAGDVCIGSNIIKQTFESYRKLRNTARYLLGNLSDFKPKGTLGSNAVDYDELPSLDKWMLGRLSSVLREVNTAMDEYQFGRATQELLRFSIQELSNFYLDVAKDRMYISSMNNVRRRSCQTVLHSCLMGFTKAIAPILPHMAEDIWQNILFEKPSSSVFESGLPEDLLSYAEFDNEKWQTVRLLRDDVNKMLEAARNDKIVGASLDAAAYIYAADPKVREILTSLDGDEHLISPPIKTNGVDELRTVLMLSQVRCKNTSAPLVHDAGD
jgi:isoleucyl-tRNA synthetase